MGRSLTNAIAKAKRNIEKGRYSNNESILNVIYSYYLRKDEVRPLVKSVNNWLAKKYCWMSSPLQFSEEDILMFEFEAY